MQQIHCRDFLLEETLYSGQFFHFKKNSDKSFTICDGTKIFRVKQIENTLYYIGTDEGHLINFFCLDFNLDKLSNLDDENFQEAFKKYKGLRIMNIDLFQTIITFICSANANEHKIFRNIELLSKNLGEYNSTYNIYSFPSPKKIANSINLNQCSLGYREKYIQKTSQIIDENPQILDYLKKSNYSQAYNLLLTFPGIGPKVANCICLFALKHYEAFPVDTWIEKVLRNHYGFTGSNKQLEIKAREYFRELGGYYQQYLFHNKRRDK